MKNGIKVQRELEIVARMLNDRSGLWEITSERLALLVKGRPFLGGRDVKAVDEMLKLASDGDRFWPFRAEFIAAVQGIAATGFRPSGDDIDRVLARVRAGAAHAGVIRQGWVSDVISLLEQLRPSDTDSEDQ